MTTGQNEDGSFRFLDGGGEMGERIRNFNWLSSPLGPIERWPQSLKTSISLILNSSHPMWIGWGPDVTFFYNDAYIDVLSLAKHPQALGKPCSEVWAEIWDICGPLVDKVFQKGEASFQNDVRFFMNRGDFIEEMFFSFSYSPIRDESGNIGGLFCPTTDVTPKVLNTRRLHTLSELAAKSLLEKSTSGACASATTILTKNPDDIPFALLYLIEPDGTAATLDQSFGILKGHFVNSPQSVNLTITGTKGGLWPLWKVMQTGHLEVVSLKGRAGFSSGLAGQHLSEAVLLPVISGGQERPLAILIAGVNPTRKLDRDYRTFYELLAGHVATAIQNARAAEAEKRRADMLAELDGAKTTFFSNVSHEFRTPLTLMLGPLEDLLARRKQSPNAEDVAELEVVHRNSLRLLKLVNTLLDFSRIEAGRARAVYVETDLAELTTDLASVFRSAMVKAGLEFKVKCTPLSQPVYVDRDMWEKIVFNLLSNAFKFTLSGGVEVSVRDENGRAVLRVRDTGIGIPADELPNVFKRFHRIENARGRSHEGTGIGLALASELVKLHGGNINVESEPGRGTVFQVIMPFGDKHLALGRIGSAPAGSQGRAFLEEVSSWLPHDSLTIPDRINFSSNESGTNTQLDASRPRILLAEDNADMRDYVYRLLIQRYQVEAVNDGAAALEAARKNPPKLVLSDVMMPRLDGFGLLRGLGNDPATRDIPIILLSARAGEDAVVDGVEAGADDYLTKPFSARQLMTRVAAHLDMDRMRKESAEKIRQSEERYRTLFNTLLEGFCIIEMVFDANGKPVDYRFLETNPAFEQQTGLHEARGKLMRELAPDHDAHWFEIYGRIALTGEPAQFENEAKALNRWYKVSAFRVGGAESRKVAILFDDITARKQAEAILRQNEGLFSVLVDLAPTGMFVLDSQFRLQQINPRAMPTFAQIEPNIGRDFGEVLSVIWGSELGAQVTAIFRHTLATGEPYRSPRFAEHQVNLNEDKAYEWETQRITLPDGKHGVVCYFNDITETERNQANLAFLAKISDHLLRFDTVDEILNSVCAKVCEYLRLTIGCFVEINEAADISNVTHEWRRTETPGLIGTYKLSEYLSADFQKILRTGECFIVRDTPADPRTDAEQYERLKIRSFVCVPLIADGRWKFMFNIHDSSPRNWREDEIGLVRELTARIWARLERVRADSLLRQNEALFAALIEEAPVGVYVINEQFRVQQINTRALPAFEKVEPKMGRLLTEVMHIQWGKEAGDALAAIFRHTLDTGEPYISPGYSNIRADLGEEKTFEWQTRRVTLPNGSHGVVCYFNDITERKKAEEILRDTQARLEATLAATHVATWTWDVQNDRVFADQNMAQLFSVTAEVAAGGSIHKYFSAIHAEDRPHVQATIAEALQSENGHYEVDYRLVQSDQSVRWVAARGKIQRDDHGTPVRFPGIIIDITERKLAEKALFDSNERFRLLTEVVEMQVWTARPTGELDYANQECVKYLAANIERDILGNAWAQFVHPDDLPEALKCWQKSLASGERYEVEFRLRSKSGEFRWFLVRAKASYDMEGRISKWFGTNTDIHAVKMAQQEAARASRAKDQFLAALSHELRTPLNPALLIASESADNHDLPEAVRLNFDTIRKNIELEARLIDDLLDLTRITTGKMVLNQGCVDVHAILNDAIATTQAEQQEKKLHLDIRLQAAQSLVEGDAVRLQQVFWNVLKNAVKFTPERGKITLETSITQNGQLLIKISDTGIGMSSAEVGRVFAAFAQGDHADESGPHRFGGLGLGLAISKNLVELHSGKITAQSAGRNQGSTFAIELPLALEIKTGPKTKNNHANQSPVEFLKMASGSKTILLVEDHEITRTVLTQLLTRRNYKVVAVNSLANAREAASQNKFDLLISDIGLPDGNGNDLMSEFRHKYGLTGIALSGYGMEEDLARSTAAGFVTHLIKPVRIDALESALVMAQNLRK